MRYSTVRSIALALALTSSTQFACVGSHKSSSRTNSAIAHSKEVQPSKFRLYWKHGEAFVLRFRLSEFVQEYMPIVFNEADFRAPAHSKIILDNLYNGSIAATGVHNNFNYDLEWTKDFRSAQAKMRLLFMQWPKVGKVLLIRYCEIRFLLAPMDRKIIERQDRCTYVSHKATSRMPRAVAMKVLKTLSKKKLFKSSTQKLALKTP